MCVITFLRINNKYTALFRYLTESKLQQSRRNKRRGEGAEEEEENLKKEREKIKKTKRLRKQ